MIRPVIPQEAGVTRRPGPPRAGRLRFRQAFSASFLLALGLALLVWLLVGTLSGPSEHSYLIPWVIALVCIFSYPLLYLAFSRSFSLFHPLAFAGWTYFIPAFVFGSLYLATGSYEPWFLPLIREPDHYIPRTLVYVGFGFIGLCLGFLLPWGKSIGRSLSNKLPAWDWTFSQVRLPALVLILFGELSKVGAFRSGSLGYQYVQDASTMGTTLNLLGWLSTLGAFLLWMGIFREKRLAVAHVATIGLLVGIILYANVLGGARGAFLSGTMPVIAAYVFSGRRTGFRKAVAIGVVLLLVLTAGMIYGTMFRWIKGSEAQVGMGEYLATAGLTFKELWRQGPAESVRIGFEAFFQRIETVTQISVLVANYETAQPVAGQFGIPSIWTMTWTAFVPRALWPEKPSISGARGVWSLYFNYGESSPAITPMIDLLINFGPFAIPVGMALLGLFLRVIYGVFMGSPGVSAWRAAGYYMFLTCVSYEGFFGTIFPLIVRVAVVFAVGTFVLRTLGPRGRGRKKEPVPRHG